MANQLRMAKIGAILALHRRKWSIRRIAKELGLHRDTVARHLQLDNARSKPARAPLRLGRRVERLRGGKTGQRPGRRSRCKTGHPGGGAQRSKQATQAEVPIGSTAPDARARQASLCEPWRQIILDKLEAGLTAQRIYQDLVADHGFSGKYHSVRRFVGRLGEGRPLPFRRMECAAGEEVQVDFGSGIPILQPDGKRRRTHVFRMVLSHSRKGYSEAVYRQTTEDFIRCLEDAFRHFGGVPKVVVLDNLKAGVETPDWYDPDLNPKLRPSPSITAWRSCPPDRGRPGTRGRSKRACVT